MQTSLIQNIKTKLEKHTIADAVLRGISQVMLQENRWTGLIFLIGLLIGNWLYALAAIVASTVGALTARILKFDYSATQAGIYGFSAALTGIVLVFYFEPSIVIWSFIVLGSIIVTIIQHYFLKRRIPIYTLPFILISWFFIFLINRFDIALPSDIVTHSVNVSPYEYLFTGTNGIAQVMFQSSVFTGIVFFIALLVSDHIAALYALVAAVVGAYVAKWMGQPIADVYSGIYGFNVVLTALVFSGMKKMDSIWVALGVVITILIHVLLVNTEWFNVVGGVLTFPFVLGTWCTILAQKVTATYKNRNISV